MLAKNELTNRLRSLADSAETYFVRVQEFAGPSAMPGERDGQTYLLSMDASEIQKHLPDELQILASNLRKEAGQLGSDFIRIVRLSPLSTKADEAEISHAFRVLAAALKLHSYEYIAAYPIWDVDTIIGMAPPRQTESAIPPDLAKSTFAAAAEDLVGRLELLLPSSEENLARAIVNFEIPDVRRRAWRPNTAFIMMQISTDSEDLKNCFKRAFKRFDITAVRSDEIEHQGLALQRILNEITASQFLVADLTDARPSVYYEVGYAHALGLQPILFRKEGTPLHFDLSPYHVPGYQSLTDLENKLVARLREITGRDPIG
ncbi:MAG: hypothetical protein ABSD63_05325 [Candidatus Korobacteraceae bacterium]|jgi:hypothetical protein